ncbi:MAG TPA: hypothetical protein VGO47_05790 [Chlamydiales bacterium]|nr:hypothetical protein [Chlamydiales bacterium]
MGLMTDLASTSVNKRDKQEPVKAVVEPKSKDIKMPSKVSPKIPSEISSSVDTATPHFTDSVRRAIRWPGKESSPLRITEAELQRLKATVRHYEDAGYDTDRTQIIRASFNYMLDDLDTNGDQSILSQIMDRINNY